MTVKNEAQLITYPDSLGGNLGPLRYILQTHFPGLFGSGIHILPPFPSSGDRGYAPLTHLDIASAFGTWEDVRRVGDESSILLDLVVNHVSAESIYFQDFLKNGRKSEYADLFIPATKIWPAGDPPPHEIERMDLRRREAFSDFTI